MYLILNVASNSAPYIGGDEVFLTTPLGSDYDRSPLSLGYFGMVQTRYFLVYALRRVFDFFHHDLRSTLFFFQLFFVASSFVLFSTLRRFFSHKAAVLSSLFYLAYVGKHEILFRFEGGFYHVVLFLFSLCLLTLSYEKIKYSHRMLLVTLLFWISLHFYELLMSVAPFFPALLFIESKLNKSKINKKKLIWSLLPLLVCIFHFSIIASAENPIWNRNAATNPTGLLDKIFFVISVFVKSLSTTIGARFGHWTFSGFYSFMRVELFSRPYLLFLILAAVAYLYKLLKRENPIPPMNKTAQAWAGWALVLFLVTPMISLPIAKDFVPSRFSYLSSMMICFPLALLLDRKVSLLKIPTAPLLAVIVLVQAIALGGLNAQLSWAGSLDKKIEVAIKSLHLNINENDALFVSIPYDPAEKHYRKHTIASGQYVDKDWAETLWGNYLDLKAAPVYQAHIRREEWAWENFNNFVSQWKQKHPNANAHFVFLDDFYRPWIPNKIEFYENQTLLWEITNASKEKNAQSFLNWHRGKYLMRLELPGSFKQVSPAKSLLN